tara:strand:+ start:1572 stop:2663 length:1092 start_codon:yes stop_codon:yes gene_type:complete
MKDWQHGFDLDYLKSVEQQFSDYNAYTLSPFAKFKKNNIAESLHKKNLILLDDARYEKITSKVTSKITMYSNVVIAEKKKGDVTVGKLSGNINSLKNEIEKIPQDTWLYVWAENEQHIKLAEELSFIRVGAKITTYGEIFTIYYKGTPRKFNVVDAAEELSIKKIKDVDINIVESIHDKLKTLPEFTNHYSNYNKDNSWSALSLRGYTDDPSFITKPIEMNKKWKEEHRKENFEMQDTSLYEYFPEVKSFCNSLGNKIHRVRFMKLKTNGGELERHTDQVDPDSGGSLGKLARIHLPIKTNLEANFTVWNTKGVPQKIHMSKGEVWFLDTRKPHQAINKGSEERIHLVVDVIVDRSLHESLIG